MTIKIHALAVHLEDLVKQLTLEEKTTLLCGANFWETAAVKRLGIPSLKVCLEVPTVSSVDPLY